MTEDRASGAAHGFSRRSAIKAGAMLGVAASLGTKAFAGRLQPSGSDVIRVGLIGCGGRGSGAVRDAVRSGDGIEIRAIGDVFADRTAALRDSLARESDGRITRANKLTDETCFSGFDAYKKVIESDVDYVLIATPPYFHPIFAEAAIDAGKHVFCEKPNAVDAHGLRQLKRIDEKCRKNGLGFVSGLQRRHEASYIDVISRLHDGAIGKLIYGEAVWANTDWVTVPRQDGWSDMEWQIRNWRHNRWLSGDQPGILAIHYMDTINWAFGAAPEAAYGVGGRIARDNDELHGNIYDHFMCEYRYADGGRMAGISRTHPGDGRHGGNIIGAQGTSDPRLWIRTDSGMYHYEREHGRSPNPYEQTHKDMIASIRSGSPLNETGHAIDSALTAIMMREAGYTGKQVTRDFLLNKSQRRFGPEMSPDQFTFGPHEIEPVARPGEYELL